MVFSIAVNHLKNYKKHMFAKYPLSFEFYGNDIENADIGRFDGSVIRDVPSGYDKDHPQAEYLKFKSWYLEYPIEDEEFRDGEAVLAKAVQLFEIIKPFNDYLNRALAGFQMPTR